MATVEAIYVELLSHCMRGIEFHSELIDLYLFLGRETDADFHRRQCKDELHRYWCLKKYYMTHHNKLLKETDWESVSIIPNSWHNYARMDVDDATRRNYCKEAIDQWIKYETETKELFEKKYGEFISLGRVADATFLQEFICEVSEELAHAQKVKIEK